MQKIEKRNRQFFAKARDALKSSGFFISKTQTFKKI